MLNELLNYNADFVNAEKYKDYAASKYPRKKTAILTCMDTRLTELLPAALGLKNGDVKMIKNAGAVISSPFGSEMRSLVIAIYNLQVEHILVIGHTDCGGQNLDSKVLIQKMKSRGVAEDQLALLKNAGIDLENWLSGFKDVQESVSETVNKIRQHPLIPEDVDVYGLVIDPVTGKVVRV